MPEMLKLWVYLKNEPELKEYPGYNMNLARILQDLSPMNKDRLMKIQKMKSFLLDTK